MKKFIFYTSEGYTEDPLAEEVENFQILAFMNAETMGEAYEKLFIENSWILQSGFSKNEIICCECAAEYFVGGF